MSSIHNTIVILGHTAAGKTSLAAHTALELNGEIISADSRQVYRGMTLGTGKDLDDYLIEGKQVAYHLIDIVEAGYEYNVYEFQQDFLAVSADIQKRNRLPLICGGTGLYIEAVLKGYKLLNVPVDQSLRDGLQDKNLDELKLILKDLKSLHNTTDINSRKRAVRAIEIARYQKEHSIEAINSPEINALVVGISYNRELRRARITERLRERLGQGMIDEARALREQGVSYEKLEYYGLEYKYLSRYLRGLISYDEMFTQLNTAIHKFAKRQMTYFRGMERRGINIHWIDGELPLEEKIAMVEELYKLT